MGGGGGGGYLPVSNLSELEKRAKEELERAASGGRRNVFISFAYEDLNEVNLLRGQAKSEQSEIEFNDWSVQEPFDSERAKYIQQKIRDRINQTSVTVVYCSTAAAESKWVEWEITESIRLGKKIIGVYPGDSAPSAFPEALRASKAPIVAWRDLARTIDRLK